MGPTGAPAAEATAGDTAAAVGLAPPENISFASLSICLAIALARSLGDIPDGSASAGSSPEGSLVVMEVAQLDVLENANCVFGEHGGGAVQRDEVLRRAALVNSHRANRQD